MTDTNENMGIALVAPVSPVLPAGDLQARVWTLYLRGWSYVAIGREVNLDRETVSKMVGRTYSEIGHDRRETLESALEEELARLRHIQSQAWVDHDTDDEREQAVLALALGNNMESGPKTGKSDAKKGKRRSSRSAPAAADRERSRPEGSIRFTSQRAHYLRVALDCEKEIIRLRGLYGPALPFDDGAQIVFRIERVEPVSPAPIADAGQPAALPAALSDDGDSTTRIEGHEPDAEGN